MLLLAPAGATAAPDRCAVKGSKTERKTKQVRVYTTVRGSNWYSCYRRTGRKTRLDAPKGQTFGDGGGLEDDIVVLQVAGPYVGFSRFGADHPTGVEEEGGATPRYFSFVEVVNVKRGRLALSHDVDDDPNASPIVTDLVLRPTGSVAWIIDKAGQRSVVALTSSDLRTLDSGREINPDSLDLQGTTLSWTNGVEVNTATLR